MDLLSDMNRLNEQLYGHLLEHQDHHFNQHLCEQLDEHLNECQDGHLDEQLDEYDGYINYLLDKQLGEHLDKNKASFYSGNCDEIYAPTKLQNKSSSKHLDTLFETHLTLSLNTLETSLNVFATSLKHSGNTLETSLKHP